MPVTDKLAQHHRHTMHQTNEPHYVLYAAGIVTWRNRTERFSADTHRRKDARTAEEARNQGSRVSHTASTQHISETQNSEMPKTVRDKYGTHLINSNLMSFLAFNVKNTREPKLRHNCITWLTNAKRNPHQGYDQ